MATLRFITVIVAVFVVAYVAVSSVSPLWAPRPIARIPNPFHRVDVNDPRQKMEMYSYASDNDSVRDALRRAALDAAEDLAREPCNPDIKARYVEAAIKYVRAWLSIVPCLASSSCGSSDGPRLDRAQQAFGSPLDRRVHEAMQKVHETGALGSGDFPKDVVNLLMQITFDPLIDPRTDRATRQQAEEMRGPRSCRSVSLR